MHGHERVWYLKEGTLNESKIGMADCDDAVTEYWYFIVTSRDGGFLS